MWAHEKKHRREVIALCVLHGLPKLYAELLAGIAKSATGKACNRCKTPGRLGPDSVKILRHESSFPNRHFLDFGHNN